MTTQHNWYNRNALREHPFDPAATRTADDGSLVPEHILAGMRIRFRSDLGDRAFVSAFTSTPSLLSVTITLSEAGVASSPAGFVTLTKPVIPYRPYPVKAVVPGVAGWVVFGAGASDLGAWRMSTPVQGLLSPKAAAGYSAPPVSSLGRTGLEGLQGAVRLSGLGGVVVTREARLIDGQERDALVVSLDTSDEALFSRLVGPCEASPESGDCTRVPIRQLGPATPDEDGNIDIFTGDPSAYGYTDPAGPDIPDDGLLVITLQPLDAEGNTSGALILDYGLGVSDVKPPKLEPLLFDYDLISSFSSLAAEDAEDPEATGEGCAPFSYPFVDSFDKAETVQCYWDPRAGQWTLILPQSLSSSSSYSSFSSLIPEDYSSVRMCLDDAVYRGTFEYDGEYNRQPVFLSSEGWYLWYFFGLWLVSEELGGPASWFRIGTSFVGEYTSTSDGATAVLAYGECPPPPEPASSSSSEESDISSESSDASDFSAVSDSSSSSSESLAPTKKNIILFVGPGLGPVLESAARAYYMDAGTPLHAQEGANVALTSPESYNSYAADYAAAITMLSAGVKVPNGYYLRNQDGVALGALGMRARNLGKRVGLVTTGALNELGLAGLYTSPVNASASGRAQGILASPPDVWFGGADSLSGLSLTDLWNLGYLKASTAVQLSALAPGAPVIVGAFGEGDFPPAASRTWSWLPSLGAMVTKALELLYNENGFLLVVTQPSIEREADSSDLAGVLAEIREFDLAVAAAKTWAEGREDTEVVVTGLYEAGTPVLVSSATKGVLPNITFGQDGSNSTITNTYAHGLDQERVCGYRLLREFSDLMLESAWNGICPPVPEDLGGTGLTVLGYENAALAGAYQELDLFDGPFYFDWTSAGPIQGRPLNYSLDMFGYIVSRFSETYIFRILATTGTRLWIDGALVIDAWDGYSGSPVEGSAELTSGFMHTIRLTFHAAPGPGELAVYWRSTRQTQELIPSDNLFPEDVISQPSPEGSSLSGSSSSSGAATTDEGLLTAGEKIWAVSSDSVQPPTRGCDFGNTEPYAPYVLEEGAAGGSYVVFGLTEPQLNGIYTRSSTLYLGYWTYVKGDYRLRYNSASGWVLEQFKAGAGVLYYIAASPGGYPRAQESLVPTPAASGYPTAGGQLLWVVAASNDDPVLFRYQLRGFSEIADYALGGSPASAATVDGPYQYEGEEQNGFPVFQNINDPEWQIWAQVNPAGSELPVVWRLRNMPLGGGSVEVAQSEYTGGPEQLPQSNLSWAAIPPGGPSFDGVSWVEASQRLAGTASAVGCGCPEDYMPAFRVFDAPGDAVTFFNDLVEGPGRLTLAGENVLLDVNSWAEQEETLPRVSAYPVLDQDPEYLVDMSFGEGDARNYRNVFKENGANAFVSEPTPSWGPVSYGDPDGSYHKLEWFSTINAWVFYRVDSGPTSYVYLFYAPGGGPGSLPDKNTVWIPFEQDNAVGAILVGTATNRSLAWETGGDIPVLKTLSLEDVFRATFLPSPVYPDGSAALSEQLASASIAAEIADNLAVAGVFKSEWAWAIIVNGRVYLFPDHAPAVSLSAQLATDERALYAYVGQSWAADVVGLWPNLSTENNTLFFSFFCNPATSTITIGPGTLAGSSSSSSPALATFTRFRLSESTGFDTDGWVDLVREADDSYTASYLFQDLGRPAPYSVDVYMRLSGGRWRVTLSTAGAGTCDNLLEAAPPPGGRVAYPVTISQPVPATPGGPFLLRFKDLPYFSDKVILLGKYDADGETYRGGFHSDPYSGNDALSPPGEITGGLEGWEAFADLIRGTGAEVTITLFKVSPGVWVLELATEGSHRYRSALPLRLYWVCGDIEGMPDGQFTGTLGQAAFVDEEVDGEDIHLDPLLGDVVFVQGGVYTGDTYLGLERNYRSSESIFGVDPGSSLQYRLRLAWVAGVLNWHLLLDGVNYYGPVKDTGYGIPSSVGGIPLRTTHTYSALSRVENTRLFLTWGISCPFALLWSFAYCPSFVGFRVLNNGDKLYGLNFSGVCSNKPDKVTTYQASLLIAPLGSKYEWEKEAQEDGWLTPKEYYDGLTPPEVLAEPSITIPGLYFEYVWDYLEEYGSWAGVTGSAGEEASAESLSGAFGADDPREQYSRYFATLAGTILDPPDPVALVEVGNALWEGSYFKLLDYPEYGVSETVTVTLTVSKGDGRWYIRAVVTGSEDLVLAELETSIVEGSL